MANMVTRACLVAHIVLLAMVMAYTCANAECPSLTQFSPCLNAATTGAEPTDQCCEALKGVVQEADGLECLCDALTGDVGTSLGISPSNAAQLPSKCQAKIGLSYTHNYNCKGTNVP